MALDCGSCRLENTDGEKDHSVNSSKLLEKHNPHRDTKWFPYGIFEQILKLEFILLLIGILFNVFFDSLKFGINIC